MTEFAVFSQKRQFKPVITETLTILRIFDFTAKTFRRKSNSFVK